METIIVFLALFHHEAFTDMGTLTKLLNTLPAEERLQVANEIIARYREGELVCDMHEYGSRSMVYELLLEQLPEEWRKAQVARATGRMETAQEYLDDAKKNLDDAKDGLSLAREREKVRLAEAKLRSAEWMLERLLSRLYGKQDSPAANAVMICIGIDRNA